MKKCLQGLLSEEDFYLLLNIFRVESYTNDCADEDAWFTEGIKTGQLETLLENDCFKSFIALTLSDEDSNLQDVVGKLIEKKLDGNKSAQA